MKHFQKIAAGYETFLHKMGIWNIFAENKGHDPEVVASNKSHDPVMTINIIAKVANFEAIFRDEEVEIEKIWWHGWKEEILNFQNIKSYCPYLMPVSHKLTSNLANFTKF